MSDRPNRRIVFAKRPVGLPDASCWKLVEGERVVAPADSEVLVEVKSLSIDPAMRAWMDEETHHFPAQLGETMLALGVGRVLESAHPDFQPGDGVGGPLGVQAYACVQARLLRVLDEKLAPLSANLGALGLTAGVTAWVGLLQIGRLRPEDTVVVSAAAGAVGSIAGQIARIRGARVIGIAGGPEKCRYVVDELGFDDCIDYKAQDVHAALVEKAPGGVDLYFDNVGGSMLDAVLDHIRQGARVVICGAISQYQHRQRIRGPSLYLRLAERNAVMAGFSIDRHDQHFAEARQQLAKWWTTGELRVREHVERGIENFPRALLRLFDGSHIGKLLLEP